MSDVKQVTLAEIEAIEAYCDAATPGPWWGNAASVMSCTSSMAPASRLRLRCWVLASEASQKLAMQPNMRVLR